MGSWLLKQCQILFTSHGIGFRFNQIVLNNVNSTVFFCTTPSTCHTERSPLQIKGFIMDRYSYFSSEGIQSEYLMVKESIVSDAKGCMEAPVGPSMFNKICRCCLQQCDL